MQTPLQITFRGLDHSDAIEARLRAKAAELEHFGSDITGCHVTVEAPPGHHHKGGLYTVRVDVVVPDGELVANRTHRKDPAHADVYVAIRDAFQAAVRQLEDYARRRRGQVKAREQEPLHGTVRKLFRDDGYGFVELSDGTEIYFHENSVVGAPFAKLGVGAAVRVVIAEGESEKGPQASTVTPFG